MRDNFPDLELLEELHALMNLGNTFGETEVSEHLEEHIETQTEPDSGFSSLKSNVMGDEDMSSLCRLCATPSDDLLEMFGHSKLHKRIAERIQVCLPAFEMEKTDTLTNKACQYCLVQLELFYQFLKTVAESENKLRTLDKLKSGGRGQRSEHSERQRYDTATCPNDEEKLDLTQTFLSSELPITGTTVQSDIISSNLDDNVDREDSGTNSSNDKHLGVDESTNDLNSSRLASQTDQGTSSSLLYHPVHPDEESKFDEDTFYSPPVTRSGKVLNKPRKESMENINDNDLPLRMKGRGGKAREKHDTGNEKRKKKSALHDGNRRKKKFVAKSKLVRSKLRSYKSSDKPCERQNSDKITDTERTSKKSSELSCGTPALTEEHKFACTHCDKTYKFKYQLIPHIRAHLGERPYSCELCPKTFVAVRYRNAHRARHTGRKPYRCNFCMREFLLPSIRKRHERTHTGKRPYSCEVCTKTFICASNRNSHQLTHTDKKPHSCRFCAKTFLHSGNRNKHQETHTGNKSYSCRFCSKTFLHSEDRNKHRESHTGKKPYSCDICAKTFTALGSRNAHRRIHTGERPYGCNFCTKTFKFAGNRSAHQKIHTR